MSATWTCAKHGEYAAVVPSKNEREAPRRVDNCPQCREEAKAVHAQLAAVYWAVKRWRGAEIPRLYLNRRFANFRADTPLQRQNLEQVRKWITSVCTALVLLGPPGTGKTHLAVALIAECIRHQRWSARYLYLPDWFASLRESFNNKQSGVMRGVMALERMKRGEEPGPDVEDVDLLLLDELGGSSGSAWEIETLGALIDRRYREQLPTIITGNLKREQLATYLGERGADRLTEMGPHLVFAGASYRKQAPLDEGLQLDDDFVMPEPVTVEICWRGSMQKYRLDGSSDSRLPNTDA